ncbi:hypothetical protein [Streptomyces sp. RPT161]|uniref:hypothetical protein n=1 Tax=Streptomyces sp. RPT161 TaxID=3015993 RepID=UPI0022B8893B|nr:hypothetical protein [Streptomyces sp. RPT161]
MKYLALGLLMALLIHYPHLAAFVAVCAVAAVGWALGQGWLVASALAAVSWRMAVRRWGWA